MKLMMLALNYQERWYNVAGCIKDTSPALVSGLLQILVFISMGNHNFRPPQDAHLKAYLNHIPDMPPLNTVSSICVVE
jgi:hypothetical protein